MSSKEKRVRELLAEIEPLMQQALEPFRFDPDPAEIKKSVEQILTRVHPIKLFKVVCDQTNNSPESIDQSILNVDITMPRWLYEQMKEEEERRMRNMGYLPYNGEWVPAEQLELELTNNEGEANDG